EATIVNEFAALRLCEFYFEFSCRFVAAAAVQTCCVFAKSGRACFGRRRASFSVFTDAEGGY
ncbi:hypothetical protein, partial [Mesorhizobium sp. M2A.F.Ca.ET.039.01.1.1]|uniref:hypothetical protein n=1 Tax=Mesorhizobium sp. M2A.F.Ca.ET.039.01.1.1 TaxID=2496746 RepID=UPI001AEC82BD